MMNFYIRITYVMYLLYVAVVVVVVAHVLYSYVAGTDSIN